MARHIIRTHIIISQINVEHFDSIAAARRIFMMLCRLSEILNKVAWWLVPLALNAYRTHKRMSKFKFISWQIYCCVRRIRTGAAVTAAAVTVVDIALFDIYSCATVPLFRCCPSSNSLLVLSSVAHVHAHIFSCLFSTEFMAKDTGAKPVLRCTPLYVYV